MVLFLICRYAVDPVLNRGVTLESLGRYDEAAADYQAVLAAQPNDPAAWNNLGNVKVFFPLLRINLQLYMRKSDCIFKL